MAIQKTGVVDEPETLDVDVSAIVQITTGEINSQVSTAKRYPRSITRFQRVAQELTCLNEEVAEACMYAVPRDNKTIEGPSARFAEICAYAWGNLRAESRPIDEADRFVTSRGTAWDIETNVAIAFEVKRRITTREGRRYNDDMIGTTTNAAGSIALRNAVLKVIPKAFWGPIYEQARKVAVGDQRTLASRRTKMLEYFVKLGASNAQVFARLGVEGEADITLEHLATLKGFATAIKEGDTTVERTFGELPPKEKPGPQRASETKPPASETKPPDGETKPATVEATAAAGEPASQQGEARTSDRADVPREMASAASGPVAGSDPAAPVATMADLMQSVDAAFDRAPIVLVPLNAEAEGGLRGDQLIVSAAGNTLEYGGGLYRIEAKGGKGKKPGTFEYWTNDRALFELAGSCAGSETLYQVRYRDARIEGGPFDKRVVSMIEGLEAD